jgi:hypothetical protein
MVKTQNIVTTKFKTSTHVLNSYPLGTGWALAHKLNLSTCRMCMFKCDEHLPISIFIYRNCLCTCFQLSNFFISFLLLFTCNIKTFVLNKISWWDLSQCKNNKMSRFWEPRCRWVGSAHW